MSNNPSWVATAVSKKRYTAYSYGGRSFVGRQRIAVKIATIINCWAHIEHELHKALGYLITAEEWVVSELFSEIRNFKKKRSIFVQYTREKLGNNAAANVGNSLKPFDRLADERHNLAHGVFIRGQIDGKEQTHEIVRVHNLGKKETWYLYTIDMLNQMVAEYERHFWNASQIKSFVQLSSPIKYASGAEIRPDHPENQLALQKAIAEGTLRLPRLPRSSDQSDPEAPQS